MRLPFVGQSLTASTCRALLPTLALAVGLAAVAGSASAESSIFDDDYTGSDVPLPPRKVDPDPPVAPTAPTPRPTPPKPVAPPKPVDKPPVAPPVPPVVVRVKAPTVELQTAAEKAIRDEYAGQLTDKSRTGRRYVADLLIAKAAQEQKDAVRKFAMLSLARDLAADAGDVRRAIRAVDGLDQGYFINGPKMRVDAFLRAKSRFADEFDHSIAVTEGLQLIEDLTAVAQYKQLPIIAPVVRSSAQKSDNKSLAASVRLITGEAESLASEFDKAKLAADVLKATPDDPAANLAVGRFLCLLRDDWKAGLPKLMKADTLEPLRAMAALESAGTIKSPAQRKQLAESWWAYADASKQAPLIRKRAQFRSCAWYGTILPSLSGLEKVVAQKRLVEARANGVDVDARPADFPAADAASSVSASPAR